LFLSHRLSHSPPVVKQGVALLTVGITQGRRLVLYTPERAFVPTSSTVWLTICSPVPAAFLSRLPTGCLCCLGTDLPHRVLVLRISPLPPWLKEAVLSSSAQLWCPRSAPQMFLHVFCCFIPFRLGQSSASCFLLGPGTCIYRALSFHFPSDLWEL
jgi:hypothetical protein